MILSQGRGPVLVLSPHTDDAELGCGGLLARLIREDRPVFVAAFSTAEESLPSGSAKDRLRNEFVASMTAFGISESNYRVFGHPVRRLSQLRQEVLEQIVALRKEISPEVVLAPASTDTHQDHQVVHNEALRAFRDISLLGYELPWNHVSFHAQCFAQILSEDLEAKLRALQCYTSQIELGRPYFSRDFATSLARVRGVQAKCEFAEALEVTRVRW
jgi:LmbE family N-acetylglucosaminyl deacetylase